MLFRTVVPINKSSIQFSQRNRVFLAGSCFAEKMQHFFHRSGFATKSNSHGIIFDPIALANAMQDVLSKKEYGESDLTWHEDRFLSLAHHGSFSRSNSEELLNGINESISNSADFLNSESICFFTFGNANTFIHNASERNVANCHRLPGASFYRKMYSASEIVEKWKPILNQLFMQFPGIKVVFTVSPVRYLKDGMVENQISKANLLLAVHELCSSFEHCDYFPAYEILMDDLRDYRFYANDMIHPSEEAQKYIWKYVLESMIDEQSSKLADKIYNATLISDHRPQNEGVYRKQLNESRLKLEILLRESNSLAKADDLIKKDL